MPTIVKISCPLLLTNTVYSAHRKNKRCLPFVANGPHILRDSSMSTRNGILSLTRTRVADLTSGREWYTNEVSFHPNEVMSNVVHTLPLHYCRCLACVPQVKAGTVSVGSGVVCGVDYERRANVAPNHTMTHVLNFALRKVRCAWQSPTPGNESTISFPCPFVEYREGRDNPVY